MKDFISQRTRREREKERNISSSADRAEHSLRNCIICEVASGPGAMHNTASGNELKATRVASFTLVSLGYQFLTNQPSPLSFFLL